MNAYLIGEAFLIGFCFVSWAIVGNRFASGPLTGTVVMTMTAIAVSFLSLKHIQPAEFQSWKVLLLLVVLGIVNGYAVMKYAGRLAMTDTPMASFAVVVSIAMVVIAPVLEYLVTGKVMSVNHLFGYVLAGGAIYLLGK